MPEAVRLTLRLGRRLGGRRRLRGGHQFRQGQAFHVDARIVGLLARRLLVGTEQVEIVALHVSPLLLVEGGQRVEVEEGVVRDDAAGRARAADLVEELRRVLDQARADLEIAQAVHAAVLDALGLALAQAGPALLELDAVAAGVGQVEGAIAVADFGVVAGQVPAAIGNHPVAVLGTADHSAGLLEGLVGQ